MEHKALEEHNYPVSVLGAEHLATLRRVRENPGCTRQHLGAKKKDTDFLISIGLLLEQLSGDGGNDRTLAFT
ncbi:hypothetical protein [Burkholderia cenocepacia]|uniref:hypothetical protein n=1 Tax=Burkholderia cenocepacia TaxID=95486 RepID=UPI0012EC5D5B|nr:hypothetical protein [Burkholderia cenocepacia]MCW3675591.1 hypothetical protein [Burkholderia cenocepacia]MDC6086191.1 hypothetical protein [Burkholderia cenocepacia]